MLLDLFLIISTWSPIFGSTKINPRLHAIDETKIFISKLKSNFKMINQMLISRRDGEGSATTIWNVGKHRSQFSRYLHRIEMYDNGSRDLPILLFWTIKTDVEWLTSRESDESANFRCIAKYNWSRHGIFAISTFFYQAFGNIGSSRENPTRKRGSRCSPK